MFDYTPTPSLSTQLCEPETLHAAWRRVRSNKGGPGSDGVTINPSTGTPHSPRISWRSSDRSSWTDMCFR